MIDPKELRIGNLILWKGEVIPVTMVGLYGIQYDDSNIKINASFGTGDIQPIPITPEWLERLGFEKLKHIHEGLIYSKDWLRLNSNCAVTDYRGGGIDSRLIKHIHQLQNLYFALTGTELTLTK